MRYRRCAGRSHRGTRTVASPQATIDAARRPVKSETARGMNKNPVIALSGDLLAAASSAALLTRLFAVCDEDLRRVRERIHKSPRTAPSLLDWLDHACGWEQDRRAGYAYPLRNPLEAIQDNELSDSFAALEVLALTFSGAAQVIALLNLVRMILPLNRPNAFQATGGRYTALGKARGPAADGMPSVLPRAYSDRRSTSRRKSERSEATGSPHVEVERRTTRERRAADGVKSNKSAR